MVELTVNGTKTQLDVPKAREVVGMFHAAIEAAVSDTVVFQFLTQKVGLDDARATMVLQDFRELRQGSRGTVYPS